MHLFLCGPASFRHEDRAFSMGSFAWTARDRALHAEHAISTRRDRREHGPARGQRILGYVSADRANVGAVIAAE